MTNWGKLRTIQESVDTSGYDEESKEPIYHSFSDISSQPERVRANEAEILEGG